ncbi:MAG: sulfatase-like hydrolase/transferase [Planctomycetota bacterium]
MPTTQPPNVIVFFTDQQRWDTMGLHGNPLDLTPNLDRYARANTFVKHSYTCQPVCGPARSCLQTGLYATANGSWRNGIPLNPKLKTLAHHFKGAGYTTGYIGKWHLAEQDPVPADQRGGYDSWLAANVLEFTSNAYDMVLYDNDNRGVKLPGYRVDAQTDAMIRYIDAHKNRPFFLFSSFIEPHHQNHLDDYPPPDGYRERYQTNTWIPPDLLALGGSTHQHLAGYYGMVKRLDEAFGRLLDALKSLNLLDNTVILFTADHGSHFKTRNSEYKRSCHEASIHVPTVIGGPGFRAGGELPELVSLIDLPPTLLDAAGIAVPPVMQGRSIKPLAAARVADWPQEVFVQISEAQCGRAIRTARWKYCVNAPEIDGRGDGGSDTYTEQYLYDLSNDPYELCNLIGLDSHRQIADELQARLIARMVAAGEQTPEIKPAEPRRSGQRRVMENDRGTVEERPHPYHARPRKK